MLWSYVLTFFLFLFSYDPYKQLHFLATRVSNPRYELSMCVLVAYSIVQSLVVHINKGKSMAVIMCMFWKSRDSNTIRVDRKQNQQPYKVMYQVLQVEECSCKRNAQTVALCMSPTVMMCVCVGGDYHYTTIVTFLLYLLTSNKAYPALSRSLFACQ